MNQCLICHHNISSTDIYKTICLGCFNLLKHPKFDCMHCGIELYGNKSTCANCLINPPLYTQVNYACLYQHPADMWVKSLKFGNNTLISQLFAEIMSKLLYSSDHNHLLIPVPLHKSRLRKRGYNQAYEITKIMSRLSKLEINTSLIRTKKTEMQAQLKLNQRANNVKNAFSVKHNNNVNHLNNKCIILIDDVMTSGNTLKECTKTLLKAGAKEVKIIVFARRSF